MNVIKKIRGYFILTAMAMFSAVYATQVTATDIADDGAPARVMPKKIDADDYEVSTKKGLRDDSGKKEKSDTKNKKNGDKEHKHKGNKEHKHKADKAHKHNGDKDKKHKDDKESKRQADKKSDKAEKEYRRNKDDTE